jgi:hypothetical protein
VRLRREAGRSHASRLQFREDGFSSFGRYQTGRGIRIIGDVDAAKGCGAPAAAAGFGNQVGAAAQEHMVLGR